MKVYPTHHSETVSSFVCTFIVHYFKIKLYFKHSFLLLSLHLLKPQNTPEPRRGTPAWTAWRRDSDRQRSAHLVDLQRVLGLLHHVLGEAQLQLVGGERGQGPAQLGQDKVPELDVALRGVLRCGTRGTQPRSHRTPPPGSHGNKHICLLQNHYKNISNAVLFSVYLL